MPVSQSDWDNLFKALFYGDGAWLGLIIFLGLFILLSAKWKHSSLLFIPIGIFMGLTYIANDMGWHALIIFFSTLFIAGYMMRDAR